MLTKSAKQKCEWRVEGQIVEYIQQMLPISASTSTGQGHFGNDFQSSGGHS